MKSIKEIEELRDSFEESLNNMLKRDKDLALSPINVSQIALECYHDGFVSALNWVLETKVDIVK